VGDGLDHYNGVAHTDPKRLENAGVIEQIPRESDTPGKAGGLMSGAASKAVGP